MAHLAAAHAAFEQLGLDHVRLLPARDPWQKSDLVVTPAKHRWAMSLLAAAEAPYLGADDTEMSRSGPTYTIDTLETFVDQEPNGEPVLILGSDSAALIPSWHRAEEVLVSVRIAVVLRPTVSFEAVTAAIGDSYVALDMPTLDLSATQIREHVGAGRSPGFLVPDSVRFYIEANGLYRHNDDST
jgi:nicotinate-nucleotide adenylyltransferase